MRVAELVWPTEVKEWAHTKDMSIVCWGGSPDGWSDSLWRTSRILWGQRTAAESRLPKIVDTIKRREVEARLAVLISEERRVNKAVRAAVPPACIHVTSYENAAWWCELYAPGESPFDAIVFDEVGRLKNPKSPRYKALRKHTKETKIVIGLNATPAPEGLLDLYAQVSVVDGGRLFGKSFYQWRQKYFAPSDYLGFNWRPQLGASALILKDLNTLAFRVDEADLAYQKSMSHGQITIELPPKARAVYVEMERRMAVEIEGHDDIVAMSAAASSMKLRQIASGFIYDEDKKPIILHEEKAHALADLIDDMAHEPLLIAYEFGEDLDAIRRVWKNLPYLGQGVSSAVAQDNVTRWNKRELPVMALHKASAGHGINLQPGGSHVCWYCLPWDLEGWLQLNGRVDRQGQTRACYSHSLIARDTIEERVWTELVRKDADQAAVIAAIRKI